MSNTSPHITPSFNSVDYFFRGAFSIDIVIISYYSKNLYILLQQKEEAPFQGKLGLPGKLILPNEDTDLALDNFLIQLIGINNFYKKQLNAFSEIGRHPLGRVVSFSYYGLIPFEQLSQSLSSKLSWHKLNAIPTLCYDHNHILNQILIRFRKGLLRHPIVFEFLPKEFTIPDIIQIYEQAFAQKVDASNFGKQIKNSKLIHPLGKFRKDSHHYGRPAKLYQFNKAAYKKRKKDRIQFNF